VVRAHRTASGKRHERNVTMQRITPCLWFDNQGEDAANYYVSLFDDAKILDVSRYGEGAPMPAGTALTVSFQLEGLEFTALNGGPAFTFNEAVSFQVSCESQDEVDRLWNTLTADGGEEGNCGWLKDKYGLSWQIVPRQLNELMRDPDPAKSARVTKAMLGMKKIDIQGLVDAYEQ
jgi:predicted 3-demethylubiquinone-9 3-methyltransferase (glyoxalase superfamily)